MIGWFRKKSRIESLEDRYTRLMRISFHSALKNPKKSEELHLEAHKVLLEIQYLSLQQVNK